MRYWIAPLGLCRFMSDLTKVQPELESVAPPVQASQSATTGIRTVLLKLREHPFKTLRGSMLLVLGYLLSPLCWWNDLVFNLPVAYGFGYLCSRLEASWLLPGTILGYWLSNILGISLMQFGAVDVFQTQEKPHDLKRELITGVVSSTGYTLVILALVHFQILQLPDLFSSESLSLSSWLPFLSQGAVQPT
jgi:hypothetical protein